MLYYLPSFLRPIAKQRDLPFRDRVPTDETIKAMEELKDPETRKNLKRFSSIEEIMSDSDS